LLRSGANSLSDLCLGAERSLDRGDIPEAIVEPSRSVAENYRNVSIVTDSGRVLVDHLTTKRMRRRAIRGK
jgi:hypothetical protein